MKKKIFAIILAAVFTFSLTACGGSGSSSTDEGSGQTSAASSAAAEFQTIEPGKLYMGTNAQFPPYEYYEGEKIVGIDAEIMEAIAGSLRGLGYSTSSMITTVTGVCGIRIIGILLVFPHIRTLQCLYLSYPVSWVVVSVLNGTLLWFICRKLSRQQLFKTQTV